MKIKRFVCNAFQENCYVVSDGSRCVIIDPGFDPGQAGPAPGANAKTGAFAGEPFFGETVKDAGGAGELDGLYSYLDAEGLRPEAILLTHSHWDHILGVPALVERFGIPVISATTSLQTPEGLVSCLEGGEPGVQTPEGLVSCLEGSKPGVQTPERPISCLEGENEAWGFKVIATPGHTPDSVCYYNETEHILFTGDTLFAGSIGRTDLPGGDYDSEIRSIMEKLIFLPGETEIYPGHGPASTIARERAENPFLEPFNEREEIFPDEEK